MGVLLKCIKEALVHFINIKFLFGSIGGVIAIFMFSRNFFQTTTEKSIKYGGCFIIGLLIIIIVYHLIIATSRWIKNYYLTSIWGDGILLIKEINEEIHKKKIGNQAVDKSLKNICNKMKSFFDKKNKSTCSVSIKIPVNPAAKLEDLIVENICRDDKSRVRDTDMYKSIVHKVFSNTAYIVVIQRVAKGKENAYYLNNNIDPEKNYETISIDAYVGNKLPYKSEFVFPIKSLGSKNKNRLSDITGFLCIDCIETDVFTDDKYSVSLMKIICDMLFKIIQP